MASSDVFTIGSVIRHRGEYNKDTTYYTNNQVTMYGSVFQALGNDIRNRPPLEVADDKTVSLANTEYWKCIIDNVVFYNAAFSTNDLSSRVEAMEKEAVTVKNVSNKASETANSAMEKAEAAVSSATTSSEKVNTLEQATKSFQDKIQENSDAIKSLQIGASPLQITCDTTTIAFEPDENDGITLSIPIQVYDNEIDITSNAAIDARMSTPTGTKLSTSWNGSYASAWTGIAGKHKLRITASYQGKTAAATFDIYVILPTTITTGTGDSEVQLATKTVMELPLKMTVSQIDGAASILMFNVPSYLDVNEITCNGISVPVSINTQILNNYIVFSTKEKVVAGTYDFIIQ